MLIGGAAGDLFVFGPEWGNDTLTDPAGDGDHVSFATVSADLLVSLSPLFISDEINSLVVSEDSIEQVTSGSGNDQVLFAADGAALAGGAGNIDAGPGSDTLDYSAYTSNVEVDLASGQATGLGSVNLIENITGGSGNDMLLGNDQSNRLIGGPGNDYIRGLGGADVIEGGLGNDNIDGGEDSDALSGGGGNDHYVFTPVSGAEEDSINETALGGRDLLDFGAYTAGITIDLASDTILNVAGGQSIVAANPGGAAFIEDIVGTDFADRIVANGNNRLLGGLGDDTYRIPDGLAGSVRLLEDPAAGSDEVDFSQVTDAVTFDLSTGNNAPFAGLTILLMDAAEAINAANFENIAGGTDDDILRGNASDNTIQGNAGADRLFGGEGNNQLVGGAGSDTYEFLPNSTQNTVVEDADASGGNDVLDFSANIHGVEIDLDDVGVDQTLNAIGQVVQLNGWLEEFRGSEAEDTIRVDAVQFERHIDGRLPAASPGDTLFVDVMGAEVVYSEGQVEPLGFGTISYVSIEHLPDSDGDLDGDGETNADDIDALFAAIGGMSTDDRFDLNRDGTLDDDDATHLIENILAAHRGDADLDGTPSFADFLVLSGNFGQAGGWSDGDFDGDGDVSFADFLYLSANFGKSKR